MNRINARALALGLFLLAVAPVLAQPGPGGRGPGGFGGGAMGIGQLVQNKSVQEELKLTDDQIAKFKTASEEVRDKFKADFEKARESKDGKAMEIFKAMNEESTKVMTKVAEDTLKPEQTKRLKQIEYQVAGTRALATNAEVQKALKLSESQIGEIKAIREEAGKDAQEVMRGIGRGADAEKRAEAMKKVAEINKDATSKSLEKLSSEQKKQWEEMTGPKFELKMEAPRGPRPGV